MDELYALNSTADYSIKQASENMVSWPNYQTPVWAFGDKNPVYGLEQLGSASSSGISDAASVVSEIQKTGSEEEVSSAFRAKIASHPLYSNLLEAYIDCQKVGAPPEIAHFLDEIRLKSDVNKRTTVVSSSGGDDPELDEFMETYCHILGKYKSDLSKTFVEASTFLNNMETRLSNLCNGISRSSGSDLFLPITISY